MTNETPKLAFSEYKQVKTTRLREQKKNKGTMKQRQEQMMQQLEDGKEKN